HHAPALVDRGRALPGDTTAGVGRGGAAARVPRGRLPRRVGHPRTHAAIVVAAAGRVGGSTRRGHRGHGRGTPRGSGGCATVASTDRPVDEGPRWVVG